MRDVCTFIMCLFLLFTSNHASAAPYTSLSLGAGQINLTNVAANYLGLGTSSVDKADFGTGILGLGNFSCLTINGVGGQAVGNLYDNGSYTSTQNVGLNGCKVNGFKNLFSGFVCVYENSISSILGNMLCSVQALIVAPLGAVLTLYITCIGLMFLMGIMNVTAKDIMATVLKIVLVMAFATDPELLVQVLYKGIMGFVQQGTNAIVASLYILNTGNITGGLSGPLGLLQRLDSMVADFLQTNAMGEKAGNECKGAVLEMTLSFMGSVPPLAGMGLGMMFTLMMMLIRTMFGYLIAITGIMFLCAIAPVFLAFALFQFTRGLFDQWVSYLMGFSLQILVVLAFISMIVSLPIQTIFGSLYELAAPTKSTLSQSNTRVPLKNWCTFCDSGTTTNANGATVCNDESIYQGTNPKTKTGTELGRDVGFIGFASTIIIFLLILSRILEATIRVAPEVAMSLSSVPYAGPKLHASPPQKAKSPKGASKKGGTSSTKTPVKVASGQQSGTALVGRR